MDKDKTICKCRKITYGDIRAAMGKGAASYREVKKMTGAGSKCGDCKKNIKKIIEKEGGRTKR